MTLQKKLADLETVARRATPEWISRQRFPGRIEHEVNIEAKTGGILFRSTSYGRMHEDAAHIEAFNPATALKLIEIIRIYEEAIKKIDEPMKYHHWEEDPYTRAACFQFVAQEARAAAEKIGESL